MATTNTLQCQLLLVLHAVSVIFVNENENDEK